MIVALAGGIGGSKLLTGLHRILDPQDLVIIGNTGDDIELFGLRVCPDLDTIAYTLSGRINPDSGWGLKDDTFHCLEELKGLGASVWFQLGDRDLAIHLYRSHRLQQGATLTQATREICQAQGLESRLLPMTDAYSPTWIETGAGRLHFQEYFVRDRFRPQVKGIEFGSGSPAPSEGLLDSIREAQAIILCPSNPLISIGPILSVSGVREALAASKAPVAAISPIVGGTALKGPAAKMMAELGMDVSASGVAWMYRDFVDVFILDACDRTQSEAIERHGMRAIVEDTLMETLDDKTRLAEKALQHALKESR